MKANYEQLKKKEIKKITVTGTTDSNGFILINGINTRNHVVISATTTFTNSQYGFLIPYCRSNASQWSVKIESWDRKALANSTITVTVYYIEI